MDASLYGSSLNEVLVAERVQQNLPTVDLEIAEPSEETVKYRSPQSVYTSNFTSLLSTKL